MKTWIVGILIFILIAVAVTVIVLISLTPSSSSTPSVPTDDTCIEKNKLGFVNRSLNFVVGNTSALVINVSPTNGTLNTITENTITYVPAVDFTGSDTFTYTLNSSSRCVIQNIIICVDQLVQQGSKIIGTGASGSVRQGDKVVVSYDGLTLAEASFSDDSGAGAVWIFQRSSISNNFLQQGNKLVGSGAIGGAALGRGIAFSSDGLIIAIGGSNDNSGQGATWIFNRTTTTNSFVQQGNKLFGTGGTGNPGQGESISLSSDGLTLAVGGNGNDSGVGATWIFTRTSTSDIFVDQGLLLANDSVGSPNQGGSVSLSSDGLVLAVGGSADDSQVGAVWIYSRATSADPFTQQGTKIIGTGAVGSAGQGISVSLSGDGLVLAFSGARDDSFVGAAWIFIRASTADTFVQQGSKLVGTGAIGTANQGTSLSLSSDGLTLAVGGPNDNSSLGAIWVYRRKVTSDTFVQQGTKLFGNDTVGTFVFQGNSVSLSGNGIVLGTSAPDDDSSIGAAIAWKPTCP